MKCPDDYRFVIEHIPEQRAITISGRCDTPEEFAYLCDKLETWRKVVIENMTTDEAGAVKP